MSLVTYASSRTTALQRSPNFEKEDGLTVVPNGRLSEG